MIPVNQTRFGCFDPNEIMNIAPGNCWTACIASILELKLEEVPDESEFWQPGMTHQQSWIPYAKKVYKWLHNRGLTLVEVRYPNVFYTGPEECFDMHCIISGPSPRNPKVNHAVVAKGNQIVHDPHPSRLGLKGDTKYWWYEFFVKL